MRENEYLIVHKSILPKYYEQVIKARELINNERVSVCDACKKYDISRSTYYKYKDYLFTPNQKSGNKVVFSIKTADEKGILAHILQLIFSHKGNIISINQDKPIEGSALIFISIDTAELEIGLDELKNAISHLCGVKSLDVIGVE